MNLLNHWMPSDWMQALGWTFVHSLWQIAIIGLLLYGILRLIPGRSAHVRYTISTLAIWLIVIVSLSTFLIMLPDTGGMTEVTGQVVMMNASETLSLTNKISVWLESRMPMMLTVWLGGVVILMMRLLLSLGWVSHMRTSAHHAPELQNTLNTILQRFHLKITPVVSESGHVSSPVTIGHLKPLILFPIGLVNQLTPSEVEAVLTHELAHIVRRDYLSNLIQSFIETLFYYHPVTWWISGVVRTERENRADDLAISWCGDPLGYAKALMTVQQMEAEQKPSLAIGFASRKGAMLARIQRILHIPYKNHNQMEKTVLLSLCSLCFLAFTMSGNPENKQEQKEKTLLSTTALVQELIDTIPAEGTFRIHKKTDDQDINIHVENGDIKELKIDGKEIAPADFDDYSEVIDELFGEVEAPPAIREFTFEMPAMPPMPPIPGMEEKEFEYFFDNDSRIAIMKSPEGMGKMKIMMDTLNFFEGAHGANKYIIINRNGNSDTIITHGGMGFGPMPAIELEHFRMNEEDMKRSQEEWRNHADEYRRHAEEWRKNWEENAHGMKQDWRAHGESMKELRKQLEKEGVYLHGEGMPHMELRGELHGLEESLGALGDARVYGFRSHGANMTEAMLEEGLIEPGEEAEILLTPDRLKINGKKMDAETHKKYLRMYEAQQGIELSGNSRVEFKTKTRRSM